jgi:hypothetical protein
MILRGRGGTTDYREHVVFGIYFYNYCDNYYFSCCTLSCHVRSDCQVLTLDLIFSLLSVMLLVRHFKSNNWSTRQPREHSHRPQNGPPCTPRTCDPTTLNTFSMELMVPGTFPNFISQKCPGRTCLYSFGDQSSRACTNPHLPGLAFCSSLVTISATLVSRSRIQELHPCPRPRTRERALYQQLNDLLLQCLGTPRKTIE